MSGNYVRRQDLPVLETENSEYVETKGPSLLVENGGDFDHGYTCSIRVNPEDDPPVFAGRRRTCPLYPKDANANLWGRMMICFCVQPGICYVPFQVALAAYRIGKKAYFFTTSTTVLETVTNTADIIKY
ncbi:MAG: hypothetical protein SVV80_09255 [Planctomycetota bacterium]|nr:hypothetical protein [Planctomycetota bacterium]